MNQIKVVMQFIRLRYPWWNSHRNFWSSFWHNSLGEGLNQRTEYGLLTYVEVKIMVKFSENHTVYFWCYLKYEFFSWYHTFYLHFSIFILQKLRTKSYLQIAKFDTVPLSTRFKGWRPQEFYGLFISWGVQSKRCNVFAFVARIFFLMIDMRERFKNELKISIKYLTTNVLNKF